MAGALFFAVYQIMLRIASRYDPPETTVLYSALVGSIVLTAIGPFSWKWPDAEAWALLRDVPRLSACIPKVHEVQALEDDRRYSAVVSDRIGPFALSMPVRRRCFTASHAFRSRMTRSADARSSSLSRAP